MGKFKVGDQVKRVTCFSRELGEYFTGTPFQVVGVTSTGVVDPNGGNHAAGFLELDEGPVRTVTRKEIVPGVYGVVSVASQFADATPVALWKHGIEAPMVTLNSTELRSAAATLIELADALESAQ